MFAAKRHEKLFFVNFVLFVVRDKSTSKSKSRS